MMNTENGFDFAPLAIGAMRLGSWGAQMNTAQLTAFIEGCLELGLTDFDHADIYGGYSTESGF
ncbi:MAG: aldo/keto reductase, partial [Bacteroidota bacterium]